MDHDQMWFVMDQELFTESDLSIENIIRSSLNYFTYREIDFLLLLLYRATTDYVENDMQL